MTKIITTILVALFSVACGGEPFTEDAFSEIQADAGASGATDVAGGPSAGSAGASHGGSPSVGGSSMNVAGTPAGGSPVGGAPAGGSGGSAGSAGAPACELDVSAITAALPKAFTWKDFSVASGNVCASCTYEPCGQLSTAWGTPTVLGDHVVYSPVYTSSASVPLLVRVAKNDGVCAGGAQCEMRPNVSVGFSMSRKGDVWQATEVSVSVSFADDCGSGIGKPGEFTGLAAKDLQDEIRASVIGLKIPCN